MRWINLIFLITRLLLSGQVQAKVLTFTCDLSKQYCAIRDLPNLRCDFQYTFQIDTVRYLARQAPDDSTISSELYQRWKELKRQGKTRLIFTEADVNWYKAYITL